MKETFLLLNKVKEVTIVDRECYQGMIGLIIFLIIEIRLKIAYLLLVVSCFAQNPSYLYSKTVKTIFYYLKATRDIRIIYRGKQKRDLTIRGYSDSNWTGNHVTRKSILGFIFILNDRSINWCSKCQTTIVLLLTEVEYIALILVSKKRMWMRLLLIALGLLYCVEEYAKIKVTKGSIGVSKIKSSLSDQEEEELKRMASKNQKDK